MNVRSSLTLRIFAFFVLAACAAPALAKPKKAPTVPAHRPIRSVASFQFCFEVSHGRCFNTTSTGRLRQVGGKSESQALVPEQQMIDLESEIAAFVRATFSAAPRKPRACQQTLAYRSFDPQTFELKNEQQRCLEFLNKADNVNLAKLVAKLSLASKPR